MNFKIKGSVVELKLVANDEFWKDYFMLGVPSSPQLIFISLACVLLLALEHKFKPKWNKKNNVLENQKVECNLYEMSCMILKENIVFALNLERIYMYFFQILLMV